MDKFNKHFEKVKKRRGFQPPGTPTTLDPPLQTAVYLHADGDFPEGGVSLSLLLRQQDTLLTSLPLQLIHQLFGLVQF